MKEWKWWIFASFALFAIAFIERVGRPLFYLAIALFAIGIFFWVDAEYREYQNKYSTKRWRKREMQLKQVMNQDRFMNQTRDSHGKFIKKRRR